MHMTSNIKKSMFYYNFTRTPCR